MLSKEGDTSVGREDAAVVPDISELSLFLDELHLEFFVYSWLIIIM